MTQPVEPYATVQPPTVTDWNYGLTRAATIVTPADTRWENGIQYESANCGTASFWPGGCIDGFTATLTRSATGNDWTLAVTDPAPSGDGYEYQYRNPITGEVTGDWTPVPANNTISFAGMVIACFRRAGRALDGQSACTPVLNSTDPAGTTYTITAAPPTKTGNNDNTVVTSGAFALYAVMPCFSVGMTDQVVAATTAKFYAGEQAALERVFMAGLTTGYPNIGVSTVQTPDGTTALPPKQALGELDHIGAQQYRGPVTLHAPRWTNSYFADRMATRVDNPYLRDTVGNVWAFGAGYNGASPTGVIPADGQAWVYATGQVSLYRSEVFSPQIVPALATDKATNQMWVIIERRYVLSVDCGLAVGVLVDMAGEG